MGRAEAPAGAGELRQLEYSQRLATRSRNVLSGAGQSTGAALLGLAAEGGAQALGVETGIAAGRPADLVSFSDNGAGYLPVENWLDAFVCASGVSVSVVWVRGRKRVDGGRHIAAEPIKKRFEETMRRLLWA